MNKYCIFIQARMSSSRTPGKVLEDIEGKPMLLRQIQRLQKSNKDIMLACVTSTDIQDNAIEELCINHGFNCFRGSLDNVLDRYISAADFYEVENIIRVGGDDPLVDVDQINILIDEHIKTKSDFIFTSHKKGRPYGCAAELISVAALQQISKLTKDNLYLEHIIPWFHNHPNQFKTLQINSSEDLHRPEYYFTVDYPEDLIVVKKIFNGMKDSGDFFTFKDLISFCDLHPEILSINKHLHQGFDI